MKKRLNKKILFKESKAFCMMPWVHLHMQPSGQVKPCCMPKTSTGTIGDLKDNTLEEIWNCKDLKQLRLNMLAGKKSDICNTCYVLEKAGSNSLRKSSIRHFKQHFDSVVETTQDDGTVPEFHMRYLDIRFSNICNFRCRSCGPQLSSRWHSDAIKIFPDYKNPAIIRPYTDPEKLWKQIEPLIPRLEEVYFAGGEPLIMEEHYRILKILDEKKLYHVRLKYNTNFSQMKYKGQDVMEIWNKFNKVQVGASLDDSYERGEYIRKGQDWQEVMENRKRLLEVCPTVEFFISATISLMNVWHIPDFHKEWVKLGFITSNGFNANLLLDPMYYRIQVLPQHLKDQIKIKYRKYIKEELEGKQETDRTIKAFECIITFMEQEDLTSELPTFRKRTNALDRIREEKFVDVFPELEELINFDER